jgi:hypothetical protein
MQLVDRNIGMFFSIKTHVHTNMSSIKLPYIISWKHHTHKDNAIHAHASFRSLWGVSSWFRYRSLGTWAPSFHWPSSMGREFPILLANYSGTWTPTSYHFPWDVNPHSVPVVCEPPLRSVFMPHALQYTIFSFSWSCI